MVKKELLATAAFLVGFLDPTNPALWIIPLSGFVFLAWIVKGFE